MTRTPWLFLALATTGCAELNIEDYLPDVRFQRMNVKDIDFQHIQTDFVFVVDNPNPIDIGLSSFSWDLDLEGTDLLQGENPEGFQLEAVGESELALPVDLAWADAWSTVQAVRGEDLVDFGLSGHFGFMTPLGEAQLPYEEAGDFPALRTPRFRPAKLRVQGVNLLTQSATVALDLAVNNDHGSTLTFEAADYAVQLGEVEVGAGTIARLGDVPGATEGTLTVPLTINLLSVGTTVANAIINKDPLPVRFDATVDVGTPFGVLPLDVLSIGTAPVE